MNEHDLQDALKTLLEETGSMDEQEREDAGLSGEPQIISRVSTFADEGLLTNDAGLVITLADGSQYQVSIVRSR